MTSCFIFVACSYSLRTSGSFVTGLWSADQVRCVRVWEIYALLVGVSKQDLNLLNAYLSLTEISRTVPLCGPF